MTRKILLITSKTANITGLSGAFEGAGFELDIALYGKEGLARASSGKPDLILFHSTDTPAEIYLKQLKSDPAASKIPVIQIDDSQAADPAKVLALAKTVFEPYRVLIAEDDRQMAEILKAILTKSKFEVKTVYDGSEALKEIRAWRPRLVVLDIMLPIIDGFHVCQTMAEDNTINPRPKILIISGRGSDWDQRLGAACGAEDYLVKPFSNASFLDKVNEIFVNEP
jgi:DNA-binding response OmpR family regulator